MDGLTRSEAVEPNWVERTERVEAWVASGTDIVGVGSRLVVFDLPTGRQRRSARVSPPSAPEYVLAVTATPALVFGWYGWHGEGRVVCADPESLKIRWQRKFRWPDEEREHSLVGVFPIARDEGLFVLLSGKRGENLFKLRPDTGATVWTRNIERFVMGVPPVWHDGRLLVLSRITEHYPKGHGHYQAIDPSTGATIWRQQFAGTGALWDDIPLIVGNHAYLTSALAPGPSNPLYVIDLSNGALVSQRMVQRLRHPFVEHDGIIYFGTDRPTAWNINTETVVWQTQLTRQYSTGPAITPGGVLDASRRLIYLGDSSELLYKLSATDGKTLDTFNLRTGYVDITRGLNTGYGVRRMELVGDRLVIGTEDRRLLAFSAASL